MKAVVEKWGWDKFKKNPDLIKQVFRYLDPDGGGEISRKEWDTLRQVFNELTLSILEFLQFVDRIFGDFDLAWQAMDHHWHLKLCGCRRVPSLVCFSKFCGCRRVRLGFDAPWSVVHLAG